MGLTRRWVWRMGAPVVALVALVGCASTVGSGAAPTTAIGRAPSTTTSFPSTTTAPPGTSSTTTGPTTTAPAPVAPTSSRDRLSVLAVDDRPAATGDYRREDWPHWSDTDGNGCDARQDALVRWSTGPATIDRSRTCRVVAGWWVSPYDGRTTNNPSDFDVDHLVPLENAFESGGWRWTAGQRRSFANDQRGLVVTSASSNRSKGSQSPDRWRPADRSSWCAYADGWVEVKQRWSLSVTTSERDALGQMLDTCTLVSPVWPRAQ
jgi:Protein of unknown function (DUF1524)